MSIVDKATTAQALAERAINDTTRDALAARGGLCADLGSDRVNWSSSDNIFAEKNAKTILSEASKCRFLEASASVAATLTKCIRWQRLHVMTVQAAATP